jgi:hypothetical protein
MGKPDASEDTAPGATGTARRHALEAMAIAARRAREGVIPAPTPTRPLRPAHVPHPPRKVGGWSEAPSAATDDLEGLLRSVPHLSEGEGQRPDRRPQTTVSSLVRASQSQSERRLTMALFVTAALVAVAAITLVVIAATRHQPASNTSPPAAAPATTHHSTTHHRGSRTSSSSTLPTPTPGAAPVISSLSPSNGTAGQAITVLGANFMSPSGHIAARFGTVLASIACPKQSTCTLTVPPAAPGAPSSVMVTVTTDSGTSNSISFSYR